ncbi:phage tail protein [Pectobacterium colocasium]|uniref:phage tail-collar fiber domain-containing protein n=1 Tax=Pectobacterium colocasium TaxID=2878098 RepID=UPI001CD43D1D|nr:phage tail protein [Pectobacterium colocasium]
MSTKYFVLLTNIGAAKLANATVLGSHLDITHMAVGDGGGTLPTPNPAQTALINEKRRAGINTLSIDPVNANQIIAEQVIPENEGGFWIREIGLFDAEGELIAIGNCAETYKPLLQEGSGRIQTVRMILIVSSTDAVTLKIDPAVVLATRGYVDNAVIEVKAYADNLMRLHLAAADPHPQYAPKASPTLTGKPTAPTAGQASNDTQLATTAFVKAALAALVNGSPAALDTLQELANALGNDPSFSSTVLNAIADAKADAANKLNAHTAAADPHTQYAPKLSPVLTGTPTAPTAGAAANDTQIATTAFVKAAIAALVNGSPAALDTLQELANALGNDPNFSTTVLNALAGKLAKDQNGADIPDKTQFRQNIGLLNNPVFAGAVTVDTKNAGIEIGAKSEKNTPFVDFNSSGNGVDFDARIIADGGSGINGGASLRILSNELLHNGIPVMQLGQYGFGGAGTVLDYDAGALFNWLKNSSTPSQIIRNQQLTPYMPRYSAGMMMRAGDTWSLISAGIDSNSAEFGGVIVSAGNDSGTISSVYRLWHDKNLTFPLRKEHGGSGMETGAVGNAITSKFATIADWLYVCDRSNNNLCGSVEFENNGWASFLSVRHRAGEGDGTEWGWILADEDMTSQDYNYFTLRKRHSTGWLPPVHLYHSGNLTPQAIGAMQASELAGIPLPFPGAVAPAGWLKCNGQSFDKALYPVLASRYPSGVLPDLRGELVRGWDDGRGVDAGRALLSAQGDAIRNITGQFETLDHSTYSPTGVFSTTRRDGANISGQYVGQNHTFIDFDASKVVPTANENRPRNIAFNYIVRAA